MKCKYYLKFKNIPLISSYPHEHHDLKNLKKNSKKTGATAPIVRAPPSTKLTTVNPQDVALGKDAALKLPATNKASHKSEKVDADRWNPRFWWEPLPNELQPKNKVGTIKERITVTENKVSTIIREGMDFFSDFWIRRASKSFPKTSHT